MQRLNLRTARHLVGCAVVIQLHQLRPVVALLGCGQRRFYFFFAAECFELYRNVFLVAVEILDQLLKNIFIVWTKRMPDPNLGCRRYGRSEEHTSELQSLMRISYAVFCLKKTKLNTHLTSP